MRYTVAPHAGAWIETTDIIGNIVKTERETFDLIFREFASVFFSDEDQLGGRTAEDLVERLRRTSFQHYAATRRGDVTLHA